MYLFKDHGESVTVIHQSLSYLSAPSATQPRLHGLRFCFAAGSNDPLEVEDVSNALSPGHMVASDMSESVWNMSSIFTCMHACMHTGRHTCMQQWIHINLQNLAVQDFVML